ncbi:MAG: hypothetical protein P9L92_20615 [Candidatus Electryonea clarkiae]|nr:hypothetical protein [Candidatus Electryonea clarkiae]MDP8285884.1 hypothetical protein [Candidatus Electryonea clarkiae]
MATFILTETEDNLDINRIVPVKGPFRLATALNVYLRHDEPRRDPNESARVSFSVEIPGGAVEVIVKQEKPGDNLLLRIVGNNADDEVADKTVSNITRMFSLGVDPTSFFEKTVKDKNLGYASTMFPDLRPVLYMTPFEGIIRLVISQRLSPDQSANLIRNLREVSGIVPPGRPYAQPAFPGKNTILAVPNRLLEVAGLPNNKVRNIKAIAASLVGEPDVLEYLCNIVDQYKARKSLEQLPGVNHRMAEHMLIYAYGFRDVLIDDPALLKAIQRFYSFSALPDKSIVARLSQSYIPWRSWWIYLLLTANETSVIV